MIQYSNIQDLTSLSTDSLMSTNAACDDFSHHHDWSYCVLCPLSVRQRKSLGFSFLFSAGRLGKPTYFSAVFNTLSPAIKQSWISNLQMAKLALGTVHDLQKLHYVHIMIRKMILLALQ